MNMYTYVHICIHINIHTHTHAHTYYMYLLRSPMYPHKSGVGPVYIVENACTRERECESQKETTSVQEYAH